MADLDNIGDQLVTGIVTGVTEGLKTAMPEVVNTIFGQARTALSDNIVSGAREGAKDAEQILRQTFDSLKEIKVGGEVVLDLTSPEKFRQTLEQGGLQKVFEQSSLAKFTSELGLDAGGFENVLEGIIGTLGPLADIAPQALGFAAADLGVNKLKAVLTPLTNIENKVLEIDRAAAAATIQFINPRDASNSQRAFTDIGDAISAYRDEILEAGIATRLPRQELEKTAATLTNAGLNFSLLANSAADAGDEFAGLSINFKDLNRDAEGLEAALILARGAGLSVEETAAALAFQTKTLGQSLQEAQNRFGLLREVQIGTNATTQEINRNLQQTTDALKFFGDTTQGASQLYRGFLETLGRGRENIAAQLFNQVAEGIGKANAGLRAFIGQAAGLGGGGAIGGALEVEEAVARGDFGTLLDAIQSQVQSITGGPLITRQEAIASGQQEQFFIQRELVKQLTGVADDQQATILIESLTKGLSDNAAQVLQAQQGLESIAEAGRGRIQAEAGLVGGGVNVAELTSSLGLTQGISDGLRESSANFEEGTINLLSSVNSLREFISDPAQFAAGRASEASAITVDETLRDERAANQEDLQSVNEIATRENLRQIGEQETLQARVDQEQERTATVRERAEEAEALLQSVPEIAGRSDAITPDIANLATRSGASSAVIDTTANTGGANAAVNNEQLVQQIRDALTTALAGTTLSPAITVAIGNEQITDFIVSTAATKGAADAKAQVNR